MLFYQILEDIEQAIIGYRWDRQSNEEKVFRECCYSPDFQIFQSGNYRWLLCRRWYYKNWGSKARVIRDGIGIFDEPGRIASIQRGKDKATEVKKGIECGLTSDSYNDLKENDIIEAYQIEEVKR